MRTCQIPTLQVLLKQSKERSLLVINIKAMYPGLRNQEGERSKVPEEAGNASYRLEATPSSYHSPIITKARRSRTLRLQRRNIKPIIKRKRWTGPSFKRTGPPSPGRGQQLHDRFSQLGASAIGEEGGSLETAPSRLLSDHQTSWNWRPIH